MMIKIKGKKSKIVTSICQSFFSCSTKFHGYGTRKNDIKIVFLSDIF